MKKSYIFFICLFCITCILSSQNYLVIVHSKDPVKLRAYLENKGYDIAGYNAKKHTYEVVTMEPRALELEKERATKAGISFQIISTEASEPYYRYSKRKYGKNIRNDYWNEAQTLQAMEQLEKKYPQWAKVYNLTQWLKVKPTVEGRALYALQVSGNPERIEDEPKILIIGLHHCRELMTHHAVVDSAADILQQAANKNGKTLSWLETCSIWFVPVVNPDGLEYVFSSDRMWRKNRSHNPDNTRGVDLNRNYFFQWGYCGSNSSSGSSSIYKGPGPNSEPEVQTMDALNALLKCQYIVSYHSSGDEVLYLYKCGEIAEEDLYFDIRDRLAKELQFGKRVASSSGEDFEHHYNQYGSISFLIEIGSSFQPSFSTYRNMVWPNVKKVVPFFLEELQLPHIHVKVTDVKTGKALQASISIAEIKFKEKEIRKADQFGSYRWRVFPGEYELIVEMKGYHKAVRNIHFDGKHVICHIALVTKK